MKLNSNSLNPAKSSHMPSLLHSYLSQSGDSLSVSNRNGQLIVQKGSTNSRFKLQYELHKKFQSYREVDQRYLKTPLVLSDFLAGKYEMEYIFGLPLGLALSTLSEKKMELVQSQIFDHFSVLLEGCIDHCSPTLEMLHKLAEIERQLDKYGLPATTSERFKKLSSEFQESIIPVGDCHGDFSLENIVFVNSSNSLVMLDFLDSPMSTPMIDLGRFWLDINYGWWQNNHLESTTSWINRKKIRRTIVKVVEKYDLSLYQVEQFAFLSALRIMPYTTNMHRIARLKFVLSNSIYGRL